MEKRASSAKGSRPPASPSTAGATPRTSGATPAGLGSWEFFDRLLQDAHVVGTPGAGFGPSGEGYLRLTGFGGRAQTQDAVQRIKTRLAL